MFGSTSVTETSVPQGCTPATPLSNKSNPCNDDGRKPGRDGELGTPDDCFPAEDKAVLLEAKDDGKIDIIAVRALSQKHTLADLRRLYEKAHIVDEDFYRAYAKEEPPTSAGLTLYSPWFDSPAVAALTAPTGGVVTTSSTDLNSYTFEKIPKDRRLHIEIEFVPVISTDSGTFDTNQGGVMNTWLVHHDQVVVTAADSANKRNWTVTGKLIIIYIAAVSAYSQGAWKFRYKARSYAK
jgi:hypothetical protein